VISLWLLQEKASIRKLCTVMLAMVGALLVISGRGPWGEGATVSGVRGYVLVVASMAVFSLKEVLFKRFFPSLALSPTPFTDAMLCVGIIGIGSVAILFPSLALLDVTGVETFEWPPAEVIPSYFAVAILMALYQTCVLAAIALTSPTFVAMGSCLAIPAAMTWDFLAYSHVESLLSLTGITLIVLAFLLLVLFSRGGDRHLRAHCLSVLCYCVPDPPAAQDGTKAAPAEMV